jgi:hypothetical protein
MIIGVSGYGATGASAVLDLLKEFDGVQVVDDFEFQLFQQPDGLLDLEYHLVKSKGRIRCNAAITRFKKNIKSRRTIKIAKATKGEYYKLTNMYIESLIDLKWKGFSSYDSNDLKIFDDSEFLVLANRILYKAFKYLKIKRAFPISAERYFSIQNQEFYDKTKDYINNILISLNCDLNKKIVLDQLFSATNPTEGFQFFTEAKAIIVDRDPRDLYIYTNIIRPEHNRYMPNNSVYAFVKYYKLLHLNFKENFDNANVLYIRFEDLIYDYTKTVKTIADFLGLKSHTNPIKYFNPEVSINNTQTYKEFNELHHEISYIESELKEWTYDFESRK